MQDPLPASSRVPVGPLHARHSHGGTRQQARERGKFAETKIGCTLCKKETFMYFSTRGTAFFDTVPTVVFSLCAYTCWWLLNQQCLQVSSDITKLLQPVATTNAGDCLPLLLHHGALLLNDQNDKIIFFSNSSSNCTSICLEENQKLAVHHVLSQPTSLFLSLPLLGASSSSRRTLPHKRDELACLLSFKILLLITLRTSCPHSLERRQTVPPSSSTSSFTVPTSKNGLPAPLRKTRSLKTP